jgi:hypothetical protein
VECSNHTSTQTTEIDSKLSEKRIVSIKIRGRGREKPRETEENEGRSEEGSRVFQHGIEKAREEREQGKSGVAYFACLDE